VNAGAVALTLVCAVVVGAVAVVVVVVEEEGGLGVALVVDLFGARSGM
jgi:hypothetical protein